jgi:ABC-2 type transport system permease protein
MPPNLRGTRTLFVKEVMRFVKVWIQTILAPVVTTYLYLAIFSLAWPGRASPFAGVDYLTFLIPGLVMMAIIQNGFANPSSSIIQSKVMNTFPDLLTVPLSATEIAVAYLGAGVVRALAVGGTVFLTALPFVSLWPPHPGLALYFGLASAAVVALVGILAGLWSQKFDHLAVATNFVILPLSFLSGIFFSTAALPGGWGTAVRLNPFFYMVDGFRYAFLEVSDLPPLPGAIALAGVILLLLLLTILALRTGWRVKS